MNDQKLPLNKFYLVLLLLGFSLVSSLIISLNQIIKIAVIIPSTLITLSCFMVVSLFLGIYLGTRFHKNWQQKLLWLLIIFAAMQAVFLSQVFITNLFPLVANYFSGNSWWGVMPLLFCFSLLLLLQLQIISLILYRLTHGKIIPEYFSAALFYLGMGSFLSVLITAGIILNYLNLHWAVFINVSVIFLALLILIEDYFNELIKLSLAFGILLISYAINLQFVAYAPMVTAALPEITMNILSASQLTNQPNFSSFLQQFLFKDLNLHKHTILVLGKSNFLHEFTGSDNAITYLNTDSKTQLSACNYMSMLAAGGTVYQDTNKILTNKYDVIVADLPNNQLQNEDGLLSYGYLNTLQQSLAMRGIAIFNIHGNLGINYGKAITTVFANCATISLQHAEDPTQVTYVCQKV